MRVRDLQPGDLVTMAGRSAVYITHTEHPLYSGFQLVIWKLDDDTWSHDALSHLQDVGEVKPSTVQERTMRLRMVLLGSD